MRPRLLDAHPFATPAGSPRCPLGVVVHMDLLPSRWKWRRSRRRPNEATTPGEVVGVFATGVVSGVVAWYVLIRPVYDFLELVRG